MTIKQKKISHRIKRLIACLHHNDWRLWWNY